MTIKLIIFFTFFPSLNWTKGQSQIKKINILFITGMGNKYEGHPNQDWTHPYFNSIIEEALKEIAHITITDHLNILNSSALKKYDLILNNSLFQEPDEKEFKAFSEFIKSGKSYFAFHAGLVSFVNQEKYEEIIGAHFINHDDLKTIKVDTYDAVYGNWDLTKKPKHPITENLENFKILDELYLMEFTTNENDVIARSEAHPIMWTKNWGKGKVLCLTLGHFDHAQSYKGFQQLLVNGIKWLNQP
ncbi:ThuA domain-containing protein [Xanthovirga aplysinae]|uniref:ThuA domain-containing protein n=1 Tax=Xanthovirga aplysinae TaxID=2529853 RepID=UPI001656E519|nr:ThuA domain-containing protein [Xanthovirga aplysinae]